MEILVVTATRLYGFTFRIPIPDMIYTDKGIDQEQG